jgi:hypothetical protein
MYVHYLPNEGGGDTLLAKTDDVRVIIGCFFWLISLKDFC